MANEIKNDDPRVIVVEFKVSMHCNACERTVAKIISKFEGVEKFWTEMKKHKVVVTGQIDPHKLLKKLKKKTGKRVEIIVANKKEEEEEEEEEEEKEKASKDDGKNKENIAQEVVLDYSQAVACPQLMFSDCCTEEVLMTFSDENPNACSIM